MIEKQESSRVISLMLTWQCNLNCIYCFEAFKCSNREMPLDLVKEILQKEFEAFVEKQSEGKLKIEFFGGEPLLKFDVIKNVTEWLLEQSFPVEYELSVTTNGTLLSSEIREWFKEYKDYIKIVLSVDGANDIQYKNRGKKAMLPPIDFVRSLWPNIHFKSTISRVALPTLSKDLTILLEQGHYVAPSLAIGEDWQDGDEIVYKKELEKLADWHLSHLDIEPMRIFLQHFLALLEPHSLNIPQKNCGTGTSMVTYDVDGTAYPCHLFVPITHGKFEAIKELSKIDFYEDAEFLDETCMDCKMLRICKTCYGFNYKERGNIRKRDRRACKMQLAEAQVVSSFQINYLMRMKQQRELSPFELYALKGALRCHELYSDFKLE